MARFSRKKFLLSAASLALVTTLAACGNTGAVSDTTDAAGGNGGGGDDQVITYNSPAEWGNFGAVHDAFEAETGISAPNDPKNSGQALAALQAEAANPVADVAYVGIAFAQQLVDTGVLQPYAPAGTEDLDEDLAASDDMWHTVHSGAVAFLVNEDFLDGAPVPQSWEDLLDPQYAGMVGMLDPTQAAVGYSVATAANEAMGGDLDNWEPGFTYIEQLIENDAIISAQTATAQVAQGEIPILIDADFNGYQLQEDGSNVTVVIPEEGSINIPYIVGLVNGAPNQENGEQLLDYYFSEEGQALWAEGFMRPVTGEIPAEVSDLFLPEEDYERVESIDYLKQGEVQQDFNSEYRNRIG